MPSYFPVPFILPNIDIHRQKYIMLYVILFCICLHNSYFMYIIYKYTFKISTHQSKNIHFIRNPPTHIFIGQTKIVCFLGSCVCVLDTKFSAKRKIYIHICRGENFIFYCVYMHYVLCVLICLCLCVVIVRFVVFFPYVPSI